MDRRAMAALAAGHMAVDFAGGALPALLPFFKDRFGLSYTLAAVIVLVSALSSSVIQPLFGLWSDRRGAIWLLPAGVAIGGVGMGPSAGWPPPSRPLPLFLFSPPPPAPPPPPGPQCAC